MLEGLRRSCTSKHILSILPSLPKRYFHVTFIWLQYLTISRQLLSLRLSDYRLVITSPGANNCMSYKTLKCLTIVRVILLKLTVVPEPTARSAVPGVSPGRGLLIPH